MIAFKAIPLTMISAFALYSTATHAGQSQQQDDESATAPVPATDPATWVTTEDYPDWAEKADVDGLVGVRLTVSKDGRVSECAITRSSDIPDLDQIACGKIVERARFRPARNDNGVPVTGYHTTMVRFVMNQDTNLPIPGTMVLDYTVAADGSVVACRVDGPPHISQNEVCGQAPKFRSPLDRSGNPEMRRYRMTTIIEEIPVREGPL